MVVKLGWSRFGNLSPNEAAPATFVPRTAQQAFTRLHSNATLRHGKIFAALTNEPVTAHAKTGGANRALISTSDSQSGA